VAADDQLRDRPNVVDRDREPLTGGRLELEARGRGGVDADHAAGAVDERTARIAGLQIALDLDQSGELLDAAVELVASGDRLEA
jgi:hypothetical protein